MNARKLIMVGLLLLLAGACIFMLLPLERYWPGALPYVELSGRLDGRPVEVSLDRTSTDSPMVEVQIEFSMQSGTFRAAYPEMGPRSYLVGGQEGDHPGHMATMGEQLGLGAPGAVFFCLVPTLLTVLAYLLVYRALRSPSAVDQRGEQNQ